MVVVMFLVLWIFEAMLDKNSLTPSNSAIISGKKSDLGAEEPRIMNHN
jgi:hypothetical protein